MEQIKKITLLSVVMGELQDAILNGELKMGEHINESAYTAKLGISRSAFREALRKMEQSGLLVHDPYRGSFVREFTEVEIKDLNNLRGVLESYASDILIGNGWNKEEDLTPLLEIVSQMEGIDPKADAAKTNALHILFHRTLMEMTKSDLLYRVWSDLSLQFQIAMRLSQLSLIEHKESSSFSQAHREVVDAILFGDASAARNVILKHVSYNIERSE